MALTDKDILITPNRGQAAEPKIEFKGASSTLGPQTISLNVYPTDNGTISFEGSAGQLFSITNSLSGTIYSVNDVSGIPSIEVFDTGVVRLAQYSGNVLLGTATDNATDKLQVNGSITGTVLKSSVATGTAPLTVASSTAVTNLNADLLDGNHASAFYLATNPSGYTTNVGTVTSVGGTGTVSGLTLSGTVTTSGNLTLGGTLAVTPSNFASQTANTVLAAPNGAAGVPTFRALVAADVPTLNQNTTGTAANVTGTVAIANGGTGATTAQAAINALAAATTSGQYLRGNGTNVVMSAIQAGDVPTLNQNTTGTASNVTGTVAIANGGTGATTNTAARTNLGATTLGANLFTITNPSAITFIRINADNTVSTLDAATFRTAIGAGTSSTTGTVTSVGGTGTVSGLTLSGTVTTSGNLTLGGTLAVTASNFASQTANTFLAAPNGAAGTPTFRAIVAADVPTLNQNTTGTAANVTGTVAIANGGTGATTAQAAINALAAATTSGQYLRGNGTNVVMSAIQAGDVPTLNQNTTGSAATLTTARTINGTSFDGSANITTSSWGTSRTITIGATGKSVDGSANVSWTRNEVIGAPPASGAYFNGNPPIVAGDGVMEVGRYIDLHATNTTTSDYDVRIDCTAANAVSFVGTAATTVTAGTFSGALSGNSTTATTLATARTLTIGSTGKTFDGSANVSWTLAEIGALGSSAKAADSELLDGVDSGSFLRSDAADTLSSIITIDTNGNIVYSDSGGTYIPRPSAASYKTTTSTITGACSIQMPTALWANINDMVSFWVDIYDYNANESVSIFVYGYAYGSSTGQWANTGATILTPRTDRDYTVRFCHDGTRHIVCIGETTSTWSYPQVVVRDFQAGYTAAAATFDDGWAITFLTTLPTVMTTSTGNLVVAKSASTLTTARTINGTSFDGSANITVTANTTNTLTRGTYLTGSDFNGSAATTWAVDATSANTASKVVARDANGDFAAGIITATDFNSTSDVSLKENVKPAPGYDALSKINAVEFTWKSNGKKSYGVIAQELEQTMPELVSEDADGIKTVSYTPLIAVLTNTVKEQQDRINRLEEIINTLLSKDK